jgi:hypothetical protein
MKSNKVLLFGNCQLHGLQWALERMNCNSLTNEFAYMPNYKVIEQSAERVKSFLIDKIKESDVVVLQPLSDKWGAYSELAELCSKYNTATVTLPYVVIDGLFAVYPFKPSLDKEEMCVGLDSYTRTRRTILDSIYVNNKRGFQALEFDDLFSIKERFARSISKLIKREEACDIKPTSVFLTYYNRYRLMLTQNHTDSLFQLLIASLVLKHLGIAFKPLPKSEWLTYSGKDYASLGGYWPIHKHACDILRLQYVSESEQLASREFTASLIRRYGH